jgi:hypothetical protein
MKRINVLKSKVQSFVSEDESGEANIFQKGIEVIIVDFVAWQKTAKFDLSILSPKEVFNLYINS